MIAQSPLSPDATPLPPGLDPLRKLCSECEGAFFLETEHHILAYLPGKDRLVVSFDNLTSDREVNDRRPFAHDLVDRQGWAILGVMVKRKDWFQCPDLKAKLIALRDLGLFERQPAISFYGTSMGGFGAASFASLAPGGTVLAVAPQSSLDVAIAPFEQRYKYGRGLGDWSAPYNDAAEGIKSAGCAYLIYDPLVTEDKQHAERMTGPKVQLLPVPHFTHKIPPMFKRMDVLNDVVMLGLSGNLQPFAFRQLMRKRRETVPYLLSVINAAVAKGHADLAERATERALALAPNWQLRKLKAEIRRAKKSIMAAEKSSA